MNTRHNWLMMIAIAICIICLIVDQYVRDLPGYVDYIVGGTAIVLVVIFSVLNKDIFAKGIENRRRSLRK